MVLLPMSSPFSRELHFCRMRRTSYTMDGFCLLCLLLILLMRSGDVETNPGPNTAESTISEMEFLKLARDIDPSYYNALGISLGFSYAQLENILIQKSNNYTNAFLWIFMKWNNKQQPPHSNNRQLLADKLREIDLGGLSDRLLNGPQIPNIPASTGVATIFNVSDMEFLRLANDILPSYYEPVGISLGVSYSELQSILIQKSNNYPNAFLRVFMRWNVMKQPSYPNKRQLLADKLREIGLGGLSDRLLYGSQIPNIPDDTDNNEGNSGQRTFFKQDSGSNQDDISFGGLSAPPEILARGRSAQRAYAEAAKAGTKKVYRTRLMLVGQERVGKTSLKKILTGQGFDRNEAITDGVETANTCEISIEDAKTGEKMWSILQKRKHGNEDTKHDEYSKALAEVMTKKLKMISPQDQEISEPLSRGLNAKEAGDETAKRLTPPKDQESLGTHSDSSLSRGLNPEAPNAKEEDGRVPNRVASLVEKNLKEQEMGTDSTGEAVSLSIWDFAGQDVYYTTHQVFLTWRAIYVIVFDLSRSLDSDVPLESKEKSEGDAKSKLTCLEFINFWLCSIYAHAVPPSSKNSEESKKSEESPTIFIVGTHRESVKGDAEEKRKKITSAFDKIDESIMEKPFQCHVVTKYYAIENSLEDKDEKIGELRKHIVEEAMKEPYMGDDIPIRWLKFEEALAADKKNYLSLDETKVLTQPMGIEPEPELLTMLTFYHDLGYVVYYGGIEDQQSLLRDMVILNPQWLIDVFKQVITIPKRAERKRKVSDAWTTLEKYGILEDRLIEHMWQDKKEPKEILVKLMDKFDLICDAPVEKQKKPVGVDTEVSNETEKEKKRYYVPSRLKAHCCPKRMAQIKSTDFYVDFGGFLPDGLFHRLMTRAVRWKEKRNGKTVKLFYRQIRIPLEDKHQAYLEMLPPPEATIKVTVFREVVDGSWDSHQPPAPNVVKKVKKFVTDTLDSLKQHWAKRIKYDVRILCPCPDPRCCKKPLLDCCLEQESLTCDIHNSPTLPIKSKFGLTEASLGNTNSTSQGPLASTVVDIPHPGASASVGEVSTSTAREVSDEMLNDLAKDVPEYAYDKFSGKLGIGRNYARNILRKHLNDYVQATRECISIWMDKSTRSVAHLQEVLIAAELGDLIRHINKK